MLKELDRFRHSKMKLNSDASLFYNLHTYQYYFDNLLNIAINSINWVNLPDTCDERYLELVLNCQGTSLFFEDEIIGYVNTAGTGYEDLDIYNIPNLRHAYASNGYSKYLDRSNSVIIYNNYLHTSSLEAIEMFAANLYLSERTIQQNIAAQKMPILLKGSEKQQLSLKNLFKKWMGFEPVIYGDNALDTTKLEVLKTDAPFVADKILMVKRQIWSEALAYLGINANVSEKKERLITNEMDASLGGVAAQRIVRLKSRQEACTKINKMFGLNLSVEYNEEFIDMLIEQQIALQSRMAKVEDEVNQVGEGDKE